MPTVVRTGGADESRLYQTSLAGCLLSVLQGSCSFCSDDVVTMMRLPSCHAEREKVAAPAHGLLRSASPPTERFESWLPTFSGLTPAMTEFHGQLSTKATKPSSGVAEWQPMQVGVRFLAD